MLKRELPIEGEQIPRFLYGTAWKEDRTQVLVELALQCGFRGIDTANQRKHYYEQAVGHAIRAAMEAGWLRREELFVQTKYTFQQGQDHRLPYDPTAPVASQVEQSIASSLEHLGLDYLDSYVLHGPSSTTGLNRDDFAAHRAIENTHDIKQVRLLGVSNVSLQQLIMLWEEARVKPRFVQNRCYAVTGWDREVRGFCSKHNLIYQGFSLLTANAAVLARSDVPAIAARHNRTVPQVVFRFALQAGMVPLTGTTSKKHMQEDLEAFDFSLSDEEVVQIEEFAHRH